MRMEPYILTPKRAQIWGMDLIVAVFIFTIALSFFYFYVLNDRDSAKEELDTMQHTGKRITDILLSEGSPAHWNTTYVQEIGILSQGKINQTKLEQFHNLSVADYDSTKRLFTTNYDYYFFLDQNMSLPVGVLEGIGKPGVTKDTIDARNLLPIRRITIYENKPVGATLYIWKS